MNTEQTAIYNFLSELMTALDGPNCQLGQMSHIGLKTLGTAMEYCKAAYTDEPMTSTQLAKEVASHVNDHIADIKAQHQNEVQHLKEMERLRAL